MIPICRRRRRCPTRPVEILLSSDDLIDAARAQALSLGYEVVIDNSCDDWDYADAARYLLDRFDQLRREHTKLCLLSGGEVTVRLGREHGAGGRNQQFALACALALAGALRPWSCSAPAAMASMATATPRAPSPMRPPWPARQALGIDAASALARFDAYPLFTALGDTLVTGPTHNNLRDLRILCSSQICASRILGHRAPTEKHAAHIRCFGRKQSSAQKIWAL